MNNAKITIKSTDDDDILKITYFGRAWEENSVHYFEYSEMEQSKNSELKVKLIFDDSSFIVIRGGEMKMAMVFDEKKLFQFAIKTDEGELDVILRTYSLEIKNFENGFEINIIYELSFSNNEKYMHNVNMFLTYLV